VEERLKTNHKSKMHSLLSNISYSISSNLLSLLISVITVLFVPKIFGVDEFGYWQLYLLYVSYIGILQFGWCDGVYLRYGGDDYHRLNKNLIGSQFWYILFFYIAICIFLITILSFFKDYLNVNLIFYALLSGLITTPRGILYYILQATNNIIKYSKVIIFERSIFVILLVVFLLFGFSEYEIVIMSDLLSKFVGLSIVVYLCKDIVFTKITTMKISIIEAIKNLNAGFKLMVSNISSTLILSIVRLNIIGYWGVGIFSKVSLTLSISNLFLIFINAVAIVVFPMLRRTANENLPNIYSGIRTLVVIPVLFILVFYYPIHSVLIFWLPQYSDGLKYMALLFPIIVYECKMSLLINSYLKSLRKEKELLIINLSMVFISLILSYVSIHILNSLNLTILLIVVLLMLRSIVAEIYISKLLNISVKMDILVELFLSISFIIINWFIGGWIGMLLYAILFFIYLVLIRKEVFVRIKFLFNLNS